MASATTTEIICKDINGSVLCVGDKVTIRKPSNWGSNAYEVGSIVTIKYVDTDSILVAGTFRNNITYNNWITSGNAVEKCKKYKLGDVELSVKEDNTVRAYLGLLHNRLENIKVRQRDAVSKVVECQNLIANYLKDAKELERELKSETGKIRKLDTEARAVSYIAGVLKGKYEDITIEGLTMKATTTDIKSTVSIRGKPYKVDFGKYLITIVYPDKITMEQLIPEKVIGSRSHPHISSGKPCLGTYATVVMTRLVNFDWLELLDTLHDFLCSVDEYGWYESALWWATGIKKEEICKGCGLLMKDGCECVVCRRCGHRGEDCTCSNCPDSGEYLEEDTCDMCDYYYTNAQEMDDDGNRGDNPICNY